MPAMTYAPQPQFWDRIARKYAEKPIDDVDGYERTLARTLSYLSPTDRVLEIGAGTASTALRIAPHVAHVTASDVSPEMVQIGREKLAESGVDNLTCVAGVLGDPALGDGPFDAILAFNLLHLVGDPAREARLAFDRLAPGGVFISKSGCVGDAGWYFRPMLAAMRWIGKAPHVTIFGAERLDAMMTEAGFVIEETLSKTGLVPVRYIVARKPR